MKTINAKKSSRYLRRWPSAANKPALQCCPRIAICFLSAKMEEPFAESPRTAAFAITLKRLIRRKEIWLHVCFRYFPAQPIFFEF